MKKNEKPFFLCINKPTDKGKILVNLEMKREFLHKWNR